MRYLLNNVYFLLMTQLESSEIRIFVRKITIIMDYINIDRSLIYKERTDLKDFGVQVPGTINYQLFLNLKELFKATDRGKELILRCFNNAYYICTLIPFEDFPETQVDRYEKRLLDGESYAAEEICVVSMAMVCKLLPAVDARWRSENSDLIEKIFYRFTHYRWWAMPVSDEFKTIAENNNTDGLFVSPIEFAPRDIIEAIDNVDVRVLMAEVEYVCERIALLDDTRSRTYGADLAIAHLNDELQGLYEDFGYNPKTKKFKSAEPGTAGAEPNFQESFWKEVNPIKKAIEYIDSHRPIENNDIGKQPENTSHETESKGLVAKTRALESMRSKYEEQLTRANNTICQQATSIKKLEGDIRILKEELRLAQEKINDFMQPVEELTADQKVRMAFTLQLLRAAGLHEEVLNDNKSKVARLIHLVTDIGANNNGKYPPTQICQNWLGDKLYYPERNLEIIKEINTLCALLQLDTKTYLNLGPQGNDKV